MGRVLSNIVAMAGLAGAAGDMVAKGFYLTGACLFLASVAMSCRDEKR